MKPTHTHFLSLIIPAYKQKSTIIRNIHHIKSVLDSIRYPYEILVVIDGDIDQTSKKLIKARIDNLSVISYKTNKGKATAIRRGMKLAKGDYVMFMDSGNEIDPNGISMLLEHMEWYKADIIVGSKRHKASQVHYPWSRKLLSYGYYYLVKILFNIQVTDTQAGIKIFRKTVLSKVLPRLVEQKFVGDLEIIVAARQLGYTRIYEAPIKLDYTFGSLTNAATLKAIIRILLDTFAVFWRTYVTRYYNKK